MTEMHLKQPGLPYSACGPFIFYLVYFISSLKDTKI